MYFVVPDSNQKFTEIRNGVKYARVSTSCWFTNLPVLKHNEELTLFKKYNELEYPKYDNYDAIEVPYTDAIPNDYKGAMGVPITFLDKYCPEQFKIIGATESEGRGFSNGLWNENSGTSQPLIKGEKKYKRLFIQKIK